MDRYTILICDDNESVHESLRLFLEAENMKVISAFDARNALEQIKKENVDLIILDIMLPDLSGMDLCLEIRRENSVPILFLSARSEEIDRVLGLEIGGDDYVTKPFSPREVAIRVKRILARSSGQRENKIQNGPRWEGENIARSERGREVQGWARRAREYEQTSKRSSVKLYEETKMLQFADLCVNPQTMDVIATGERIEMTAKEVRLLSYLVGHAQQVLNREQILEAVWGYDYFGDTRAVDAMVKRIRKKVAHLSTQFEIQSIYGVGYRLQKK